MTYLDHHATTAPAPEVLTAMLEVMRQTWANPSSPHEPGQQAKRVLASARGQVAQALGCKPAEVIFTSGATESNQLALLGLLAAAPAGRTRLVISSVEHAGLLKLARTLAAQGRAVDFIPVQSDGQLDLDAAARLIAQPDVALVSVMAANNETGVLMPLPQVAALAQAAGVPLHVDATQLIGKLPFHFGQSGAAAVSLSAHKLHGPKGVGALLLRQGVPFATPTPGSQERARRGGTENLPGIVGLATALGLLGTPSDIEAEAARQAALRDHLEAGLRAALPATQIWSASAPRLPGLSYWRVGLIEADVVLERLGRLGVAAASGSACASGGSAPSHVLTAMGASEAEALATVRLSLGRATTLAEIDSLLAVLPPLLAPLLTPTPAMPVT